MTFRGLDGVPAHQFHATYSRSCAALPSSGAPPGPALAPALPRSSPAAVRPLAPSPAVTAADAASTSGWRAPLDVAANLPAVDAAKPVATALPPSVAGAVLSAMPTPTDPAVTLTCDPDRRHSPMISIRQGAGVWFRMFLHSTRALLTKEAHQTSSLRVPVVHSGRAGAGLQHSAAAVRRPPGSAAPPNAPIVLLPLESCRGKRTCLRGEAGAGAPYSS